MEFRDRKVQIFKTIYSIEYIDKVKSSDSPTYLYGYTDTDAHKIFISVSSDKGEPLNQDLIDGVLRLELIKASRHELQKCREEFSETLYGWLDENMDFLYKSWALGQIL